MFLRPLSLSLTSCVSVSLCLLSLSLLSLSLSLPPLSVSLCLSLHLPSSVVFCTCISFLSLCLFTYLSQSLCICLSVFLCISLCLSLCMSISFSSFCLPLNQIFFPISFAFRLLVHSPSHAFAACLSANLRNNLSSLIPVITDLKIICVAPGARISWALIG